MLHSTFNVLLGGWRGTIKSFLIDWQNAPLSEMQALKLQPRKTNHQGSVRHAPHMKAVCTIHMTIEMKFIAKLWSMWFRCRFTIFQSFVIITSNTRGLLLNALLLLAMNTNCPRCQFCLFFIKAVHVVAVAFLTLCHIHEIIHIMQTICLKRLEGKIWYVIWFGRPMAFC